MTIGCLPPPPNHPPFDTSGPLGFPVPLVNGVTITSLIVEKTLLF